MAENAKRHLSKRTAEVKWLNANFYHLALRGQKKARPIMVWLKPS
jgi:hypothetical protein